jgi:hypothetical protein
MTKKISELTAATSLTTADTIEVVQSSTSKKATLALAPISTATQTALDAKSDKISPLIKDDGSEIVHAYFNSSGIVETVPGVSWIAARNPPCPRVSMPAFAGASTRTRIGVFSDANYFTMPIGSPMHLASPFTMAICFESVSNSNSPNILDCTGSAKGYNLQTVSGGGAYFLTGAAFDGPLSGGAINQGLNTIIFGYDGAKAWIKVNNSVPVSKTVSYTAQDGATLRIGRGISGGVALNGKIDELWASSDTPTSASLDALYVLSQRQRGGDYRFPDSAATVMHLHGRSFNGTTWTCPQGTTITTVGTVPSATANLTIPTLPSRYAIEPAGTFAGTKADTAYYYLAAGANPLNLGTTFSGTIVFTPGVRDLAATSILCSSGLSSGQPGWQVVVEGGNLVLWGSTGSVTSSILPSVDKINVVSFGVSTATGKLHMKLNDNETKSATGTITVSAGSTAQQEGRLGMHVGDNIGFDGIIHEFIVRSTAPSDSAFAATLREILFGL